MPHPHLERRVRQLHAFGTRALMIRDLSCDRTVILRLMRRLGAQPALVGRSRRRAWLLPERLPAPATQRHDPTFPLPVPREQRQRPERRPRQRVRTYDPAEKLERIMRRRAEQGAAALTA